MRFSLRWVPSCVARDRGPTSADFCSISIACPTWKSSALQERTCDPCVVHGIERRDGSIMGKDRRNPVNHFIENLLGGPRRDPDNGN